MISELASLCSIIGLILSVFSLAKGSRPRIPRILKPEPKYISWREFIANFKYKQ